MGFWKKLFGKGDELQAASGVPTGSSMSAARTEAEQIQFEIERYEGELDEARQQALTHPQMAENFESIVRAKEQQIAAARARLERVQKK